MELRPVVRPAVAGPAPELWERFVAVPGSWFATRPGLASWLGRVRWAVLWVSLFALVLALVFAPAVRESIRAWWSCVLLLVGVYALARTKTLSWRVVAGVFSISLLWAPVIGWISLELSGQVREFLLTQPFSARTSHVGSAAASLASAGTAVAAFTEESLKLLPVVLIAGVAPGRVRRFAVVDWLLVGFAAGLGFQAFEDVVRRLYVATAKPGLLDFLVSDEERAAGMAAYHWWWPFSGGSFQSSGDLSFWYAGHHVFTALVAVAGGLGVAAWRRSRSCPGLRQPAPGSGSSSGWTPSRWGWRVLAVAVPVGTFWMVAVDHFGFNASADESRWLDPAHSTVPWPIRWTWSVLGHGQGMGVLLFFLLCLGILLDAARVRGLPGVSVLPAPAGGLQRVVASVLGRWPAGVPVLARTTVLKVADALAWAVVLIWRDMVVVLAAHAGTTPESGRESASGATGVGASMLASPGPDAGSAPGSASAGWAGRVAALEGGRAAAVMVRSVRREQHAVLADLSAPPSSVVGARRGTRLVAVGVLVVLLVVALVFAPGLARQMGPGIWEGTLLEHLGVWLAGVLDVLGGWWNGLSPGQQILAGAGLAALVVLSGGSLGLALGASGVATYGLSHAAGLASWTRDPRAATGSYLSHATPASVLLDGGEFALTFLPGNFTGAVAGRALRDGVHEFSRDPAAFRAALSRELRTNPERGSTGSGSHLGERASDVTVAAEEAGAAARPLLNMAKQEKHIPGARNFIHGRSELTGDPETLLSRAGSGQPVNSVPRGAAGFRERVDYGGTIGRFAGSDGTFTDTSVGIIHYAADGTGHIVPARPLP